MENTELATKIREAKATIPSTARTTLKTFANEQVKKLQLVTKSYKYDFPFLGQASCRASNYRIACLLERQLLKRHPYLKNTVIPFIEKGRNGITINVNPSVSLSHYMAKLGNLSTRISFPVDVTIGNYTKADSAGVNRNVFVIFADFNSNRQSDDSYGYITIFYLKSLIKILDTLQRKAFYE